VVKCQCNRATGTADCLLDSIVIVRCTVSIVGPNVNATEQGKLILRHYRNCALYRLYPGFTVSATVRAELLLVIIEIVRCTVGTLGLIVSATRQQVLRTDFVHYIICAL